MKIQQLWILSILTGCTLSPTYQRPEIEMPTSWRTEEGQKEVVLEAWWQGFQDPLLNQLVQEALSGNQDLQGAIARVDQFQQQLEISRSKFFPQLQISGALEDMPTSVALQQGDPFQLLLSASYLVDLWGSVRSRSESSYQLFLASIEARRVVALGVVTATVSTYIRLRQFQEEKAISERTYELRKEALFLAKVRYELGLTSEIQVEQALVEVQEAKLQIERFSIAIAESENLLSLLLGKAQERILPSKSLDELCLPKPQTPYLPSEIIAERPDIREQEHKLRAFNANIGVARAKFFPEISLIGGVGFESTKISQFLNHSSSLWDYGVSLLQEVFTGGRLTAGVRLSEAEKQEALHEYLATILNAFKEVNDAITTHQITLELVETEKVKVAALSRYLHLADLRYKEGETDYLTFLDAERDYFSGELKLAEAKGDLFVSLVKIYEALGGSWVIVF